MKDRVHLIVSVLLFCAGWGMHPQLVGFAFADDGNIDSLTIRLALVIVQSVLIGAGAWLCLVKLLSGLSQNVRSGITGVLILISASLSVFGAKKKEHREMRDTISAPRGFLTNWEFDEANYNKILGESERAISTGCIARAMRAHALLGQVDLSFGNIDEALKHYKKAESLAPENDRNLTEIQYQIGVTYLRRGEVAQCVNHHNSERCLFPVSGGGVWNDPSDAVEAYGRFRSILDTNPLSREAKWMLNLSLMVAGETGAALPSHWQLPVEIFREENDILPFEDRAAEFGTKAFNMAGSAVMDDFDCDGKLDIVTAGCGPGENLIFYRNQGHGQFSDQSEKSQLGRVRGGLNLIHADFDNDGLLDIFVLRGAWQQASGYRLNSLIRQLPGAKFEEVTQIAGLGDSAFPTQTAAWADYDNDGFLDLYIGNENEMGELFWNDSGERFLNVTSSAGIQCDRFTKGVAWGDVDNDGDMDLFISNFRSPNQFYANNGDGTFSEVLADVGLADSNPNPAGSFATWFFDFNNDGWQDLFLCQYNGLKSVLIDVFEKDSSGGGTLKVFLNDGDGTFTDRTEALGMNHVRSPMGANFGDIDNDGWLDVYLGTGGPRFDHLTPNVVYRNDSGKKFVDVTNSARLGHLQKGHGIAFGDVDSDGDQDVYAQMGGFYLDDKFHDAFFVNPGNENNWVIIRLEGRETNRSAIGARVNLVIEEEGVERSVHRVVSPGGSFGSNSFQLEVGLGCAEIIRQLEVYWPTSGSRQIFKEIAVKQVISIVEGNSDYEVVGD